MSFGPTRNNRGAGNSGEQLVQFRLGDAKRISDAVTWVEGHRRDRKPSVLPRAAGGGDSGSVSTAVFSGSWLKGQPKIVSFDGLARTAVVMNVLFDVVSNNLIQNCTVLKSGQSYYLISSECA